MVEKDPARLYYEEVKKKLGSDHLTIIVIKAQDVFTTDVLETIKRLSDALRATPGVTHVESLTTVNNIKARVISSIPTPWSGLRSPKTPPSCSRYATMPWAAASSPETSSPR